MSDVASSATLCRASVQAAQARIAPHVHRTPVMTSRTLSDLASTPQTEEAVAREGQPDAGNEGGQVAARPTVRLWFKCENLQRTGAFKVRGAFHAVGKIVEEPGWVEGGGKERGVVTHSSGNHAQALALAARENGIRAHVVMPEGSAREKMEAARGYGARVVVCGGEEREAVAARVVEETGGRFVSSHDDVDVVLGQGTLGLELQEQVAEMMSSSLHGGGPYATETTTTTTDADTPTRSANRPPRRLDAIIAPCGGGGLLSGIALACDGTGVRVFGAEPTFEGADDARRGLARGRRVASVSSGTVADGLRTPLGKIAWGLMADGERGLVEGVHGVSEGQILAATRLVLERLRVVAEPSGCVALAAVLFDEAFRRVLEREGGKEGWDLGVVVSGGNVGLDGLGEMLKM